MDNPEDALVLKMESRSAGAKLAARLTQRYTGTRSNPRMLSLPCQLLRAPSRTCLDTMDSMELLAGTALDAGEYLPVPARYTNSDTPIAMAAIK
jgi:hypothetical protein